MNDIMIQVSLQDLLMGLLTICGVAVLIALVVVLARVAKTLKKLNTVMDDAKVITSSVSDKVVKLDGVVDTTVDAVSKFTTSMKENQGLVKTLGSVAKACSNIATYLKEEQNKK